MRRSAFLAWAPAPVQALLAGLLTWLATGVGAATVIFCRRVSQRMLAMMLGLAAGVMLAAYVWSLLAPSSEIAGAQGLPGWLPAVVGFLLGGAFIRGLDLVMPHWHRRRNIVEGEPST